MRILPKQVSSLIAKTVKKPTKRLLQQTFHSALAKVSGGKEKALSWSYAQFELSPYVLLQGYLQGTYPMPDMNGGKTLNWYDPELRGIIPIPDFKIRNDLLRCLKKEKLQEAEKRFEIKINANFHETLLACSKPRGGDTKTWITPEYIKIALQLHNMGIAHSIETYQNGVLVGGVFGISINGYFVTLSLFHSVDNAAKIAFYYLLVKLRDDGFKLHVSGDANTWFSQYGAINIAKNEFREQFMKAITTPIIFSNKVPELAF
ncbi:leucyl/phenylalanyl-tRNA--protein transferase [Pedobacter nyackensis]|uniref:leucyl/phenylalanyl-tRNA--protein transferase n=1 Tax=Pedobacter nyackensis TaxID=475255 RepID=UPI00293019F4|nr:leucyl/phenylalanyl-tRNA--protein transferase [Pedobacter nyackensis]